MPIRITNVGPPYVSFRAVEIHVMAFARERLLTNGWNGVWITIQRHYEKRDILMCAKGGGFPTKRWPFALPNINENIVIS